MMIGSIGFHGETKAQMLTTATFCFKCGRCQHEILFLYSSVIGCFLPRPPLRHQPACHRPGYTRNTEHRLQKSAAFRVACFRFRPPIAAGFRTLLRYSQTLDNRRTLARTLLTADGGIFAVEHAKVRPRISYCKAGCSEGAERMQKVNLSQVPVEETPPSPAGRFRSFSQNISQALG